MKQFELSLSSIFLQLRRLSKPKPDGPYEVKTGAAK